MSLVPLPLILQNVRVVLLDGASHPVDSNELAFRVAAIQVGGERGQGGR